MTTKQHVFLVFYERLCKKSSFHEGAKKKNKQSHAVDNSLSVIKVYSSITPITVRLDVSDNTSALFFSRSVSPIPRDQ